MDTTKNSREEAARQSRQEAVRPARNHSEAQPKRRKPPETVPADNRCPRPEPSGSRPAAERKTAQKPERTLPQAKQEASHREEAPRQRQAVPQRENAPHPKKPAAQRKPSAQPVQEPKRQAKVQPKPQKAPGKSRKSSRAAEQPDDLSSTRRAYGKSKPKKKSSLAILGEAIAASAKEGAAKRRARQQAQGRRSGRRSQAPAPAVIYTQPQAFNRDRLLVQLITVTAVVVAFVVGLSVFFKVEQIRVSGAEVYTAYSVEEASGIQKGDNLLTFSRARAGALIKANLPYVKNVSFGIKLPDTVNIIIEEEDVVYAIKDQDEQWWLINSDGQVVDQAQRGQATNNTQILGVALDHPLRDQMATAVEALAVAQDPISDTTAETTEEVVIGPSVSGEQRLNTALQIVKALEANDIVGSAASINVSQTQNITLWYGTRYQVNLGDTANLEYKIACMNSVIMSMQDYQSGILDISFTIWPDQVGYTPFA